MTSTGRVSEHGSDHAEQTRRPPKDERSLSAPPADRAQFFFRLQSLPDDTLSVLGFKSKDHGLSRDYTFEIRLETRRARGPEGCGSERVWGSHHRDLDEGERLARLRREALDWQRQTVVARTDSRELSPGLRVSLSGHGSLDGDYLVVELAHEAGQESARPRGPEARGPTYGYQAVLIPVEAPYRVAVFDVQLTRRRKGYDYTLCRVMRVVERTMDRHGQTLLVPEISVEGWWTSLTLAPEKIIALYADHDTSEQFHSEFKTDLDIERLPSGKFATNALVLGCATLGYNILRWTGQHGLTKPGGPVRHPARRRRIRTVLQELMYLAARVIETSRRLKLGFGRRCVVVGIFQGLYHRLACG